MFTAAKNVTAILSLPVTQEGELNLPLNLISIMERGFRGRLNQFWVRVY
jgi:hypothetical protein